MQINYRQYPHPVLSYFSDDLVDCAYQTTLRITTTKTTYRFEAVCRTSSKDLSILVKNQKAYYAFHIECPRTRFREIFTSFLTEFSFEIPADKLDGKVQICSFILAAEDLPDYRNRNFHSDYGNTSFKVKKGDVLAVDRDRSFDADKEIDPLKKLPSIFTVTPNEGKDAPPFEIDTNDNKVVIKLSKENFERYKILSMNQSLHTTLASLLIVPALVSLLEMIKGDVKQIDELEEYRWFRVLANKLHSIGIEVNNSNSFTDSSVMTAQKLIGNPLSNSLKTLEGFQTED